MQRRNFLSNTTLKLAATASLVGMLVACGGGSDPVSSATLVVVPALGAVYNADVMVLNVTGDVLGSGSTGRSGTASVKLYGSTTGPIVVKLSLTTASSYFNEKTGQDVQVTTPAALLSVTPSLPTSVGVTPLTNTAAKLAGLNPATVGTTAITGLTTTRINEGVARTLLALGLPANFPLLSAPVPATLTARNPTDLYGNLLAQLAARATVDPLTQALDFAAAVSNGAIASGGASVFTSISNLLVTIAPAGITLQPAKQTLTTEELAAATGAVNNTFVPAGSTGSTGSTGGTGGTGSGGGSI
jgi:hypothetical protein